MFYDINKGLCESYPALDPIKLGNYPAEEVFDLINSTIDYNSRQSKNNKKSSSGMVRKQAGDNWF